MNPRLFAVAGPLTGSTITLTEAETSLGRESANLVAISDLSLSRRHCVVARDGDEFKVRDLESLNGTYVNGAPVKEKSLSHGDHLRLGDTVFIFLSHEGEAPPISSSVRLSDDNLLAGNTVLLRREDAKYLDAEKVKATLPRDARTARDLNTLLKISAAIPSARSLGKLQTQLMEMIAEVIPAERGAILWAEGDEFDSVFGWDRKSGASGEVIV